jgi:LysM repeat protein
MRALFFLPFAYSLLVGCSPLTSSAHDEKYKLELTLHEVQTNVDDLRHDINCFQTELQIFDGRIKYYENALAMLKQQDLEKHQTRIDLLTQELQSLEKRWASSEKHRYAESEELLQLTSHAKETTTALLQFRERIEELEKELAIGQRRFEELGKLKTNIEALGKALRKNEHAKIYKVRPGDSLEKIAKAHHLSIEKIKKLNHLEQDLIFVGQELKIPE